MVALKFLIDIIWKAGTQWPWGQLRPWKIRVPGIFLGGRGGQYI